MIKHTLLAVALVLVAQRIPAQVTVPKSHESPDTPLIIAQHQYHFEPLPGRSLSLMDKTKTVWAYHFEADGGTPYFHPLATVAGDVLSDFAPADHRWHRGLWFSWKYLNGVNYWDWAGKKTSTPDGETRRIGEAEIRVHPLGASVVMRLHYMAGIDTVLEELRRITAGVPRLDGRYTLDWQMHFTSREKPVVFERTPPAKAAWGGYGGLSFLAAGTTRPWHVLDSEGRQDQAIHGQQARWVDFTGQSAPDKPSGVVIFDDPKNPRHPTPWYVATGGMGYVNPAFLFHEPYTVPPRQSLSLRYRVVMHPGRLDAAAIEREYQIFLRDKPEAVPQ